MRMALSKVTLAQQLAICQQVARLVRAKLPISGELSRSIEQATPEVQGYAQTVEERVAQGKSLADALAQDDSRSSRILAACVESGELSQSLDRTLESWSGMHIANAKASQAMRTALLYPSMLILVTLLSLAFVIWSLIPEYRETYSMFQQELPWWLESIVWVREQFGPLMILVLLLLIMPLMVWAVRRRRFDALGLPLEPARRMRIQALSSEVAGQMLLASVPLNRIVPVCAKAVGANSSVCEQAFGQVQHQQSVPCLTRETSMLLASLHAGLLPPKETAQNLFLVASHLRDHAETIAARQARWIPMLVALTVGCITILTYVLLIYLPWIWLLQRIVDPIR